MLQIRTDPLYQENDCIVCVLVLGISYLKVFYIRILHFQQTVKNMFQKVHVAILRHVLIIIAVCCGVCHSHWPDAFIIKLIQKLGFSTASNMLQEGDVLLLAGSFLRQQGVC